MKCPLCENVLQHFEFDTGSKKYWCRYCKIEISGKYKKVENIFKKT